MLLTSGIWKGSQVFGGRWGNTQRLMGKLAGSFLQNILMVWMATTPYALSLSLCFPLSYLADQCWNGGCIYLIMLRRIKRKAPPPPCNGNGDTNGTAVTASREVCRSEEQRTGDCSIETPGSPAQNGKRTRKFGVVSRSSSNRDSKDSIDSRDSELENGYHSPCLPAVPGPLDKDNEEAPSEDRPRDERANTLPHAKGAPSHLQNGGTATLPTRYRLLERKTGSVSSDASSQVGLWSAVYKMCFLLE